MDTRIQRVIVLCILGILSGCSSQPGGLGSSAPATVAGAPRAPVSTAVVDTVDTPDSKRPKAGSTVVLPDVIELPAAYRWQLVNGRPVLIRETDPRKITAGGAMQIVAGDVSRGEVTIQPALLPQEIAAEMTRNRALQTQMIEAFNEVNRRVSTLIGETRTMQQRNAELLGQLAQATERVKQLEAQLQEQGTAPKN